MVEDKKRSNIFYIIAISLLIINGFLIFYVIQNVPNATILWNFVIFLIILSANFILLFFTRFDSETKKSYATYFGIWAISSIFTTAVAVSGLISLELEFYYFLQIVASVVILISLIANAVGLERKDVGFHINIHNPIVIPRKLMLPVYAIAFFLMMGSVFFIGNTFIGYPILGALGDFGVAIQTAFQVARPENIVFIILPYAGMLFAFRVMGIENPFFTKPLAGLGSMSAFGGYHWFRYSSNFASLMIVVFVGMLFILLYELLKTLIIMDALHEGSNFSGVLFRKTQFAVQTLVPNNIGISQSIMPLVGIMFIIIAVGLIYRYNLHQNIKLPKLNWWRR